MSPLLIVTIALFIGTFHLLSIWDSSFGPHLISVIVVCWGSAILFLGFGVVSLTAASVVRHPPSK